MTISSWKLQRQKREMLRCLDRSLVMGAQIGIALEDLSGNVQYVNSALAAMFGCSTEELVGMRLSHFTATGESGEGAARRHAMLAGLTDGYQLNECYIRRDESCFWARVNVSLLSFPDRTQVVLATVDDLSEIKRSSDRLSDARQELRRLTAKLLQTQEEERIRIARDLHDDIGQRLSLVITEMDLLQLRLPPNHARSSIRGMLDELNELMSDLQNMSHQLHSAKLQYLGLVSAMQDLCTQNAAKHDISIELSAKQVPRGLPDGVALCFYRVAQEALRNAIKHSRSARIEVSLTGGGRALLMHVVDYGIGFRPSRRSDGLGLITMQERMRAIGGSLTIESHPGRGCRMMAVADIQQGRLMLASGCGARTQPPVTTNLQGWRAA